MRNRLVGRMSCRLIEVSKLRESVVIGFFVCKPEVVLLLILRKLKFLGSFCGLLLRSSQRPICSFALGAFFQPLKFGKIRKMAIKLPRGQNFKNRPSRRSQFKTEEAPLKFSTSQDEQKNDLCITRKRPIATGSLKSFKGGVVAFSTSIFWLVLVEQNLRISLMCPVLL